MSEEQFLVRITGKGVTFKRRVPGWLAAAIVLYIGAARLDGSSE